MQIEIRSYIVLFDKKDANLVQSKTWTIVKMGKALYAMTNIKTGGKYKLTNMSHIVITCPPHKIIDHINGNGLDNRRINLRICTRGENNLNRKLYITNKTGHKGIHFRRGRYYAQIKYKTKIYCLGTYDKIEDAINAYDKAAIKYFKNFRRKA
jgi:hypothetical protein